MHGPVTLGDHGDSFCQTLSAPFGYECSIHFFVPGIP